MQNVYDVKAPKKATNLSLNSDLLKKSRKLNINLSAVLEQALIKEVRERQKQEWVESNRDAIETYNQQTRKNGIFSDELRIF